jgi:hypothetical protein
MERRSLVMTNSECEPFAEKVLEDIMELLDEERISREVDTPIDQAVQTFRLRIKKPLSHGGFNRVIDEFVRHLYRTGLRLPRELTHGEALTEAVYLLENTYRGVYTSGYEGALLDARDGTLEGVESVLSRLGESIKVIEREKYTRWALIAHVERLDWSTRYRLVLAYLKRYNELLPQKFRELDPARLVDYIPDLVINHLAASTLLRELCGLD